MASDAIAAIVLAGERAGGNALARAYGLSANVLVDVGGLTAIERVIATLRASTCIDGGLIAGPDALVCEREPVLKALFAAGDFRWSEPARGPSASALAAAGALGRYPVLLTAADHALLTAEIVDSFCTEARERSASFVVGLVPYRCVARAFPASRRTRLRFSDATYCGANLFLINTQHGLAALRLWRALERERKRPWRIAARLGVGALWRYLVRGLSTTDAFAYLSARAATSIDFVALPYARAAVDVDSSADLALARAVIAGD